MGWWTPDRTQYALNYLINAGLTPYGAAGMVSRWANVEASGGPASVNPYSGAFGIAQWLTPSRLNPIRGNTDFNAQLAYVVRELNGAEYRAASVLRRAQTAWEGALGASMYERAEGYNQSTGVDNFTQRTAAGIPAILGAAGNVVANTIAPVIPGWSSTIDPMWSDPFAAVLGGAGAPQVADQGDNTGVIVAVAAAAALILLIW